MKIDVTKPIKDLKGNVVKHQVDEDVHDMTFLHVAQHALLVSIEGDGKLSGEDKLKRFRLATKLQEATEAPNVGVADLSVDEAAKLKDLIGKVWSPLIVGRAWDIIEPPTAAK